MSTPTNEIGALYVCEVARKLGLSESTVKRMIHTGELKGARIGRRRLVVFADSLEAYTERLRRERERDAGRNVEAGSDCFSLRLMAGSDGEISIRFRDLAGLECFRDQVVRAVKEIRRKEEEE